MTSPSLVNMQNSSMEPLDKGDTVSGCSDIKFPDLDKLSQLTNAVSNIRPLLETFKQEQLEREQHLAHLTEENSMLKVKIQGQMESIQHLSPATSSDLSDEIVSLQNKLQYTESLLQAEGTKFQESCGHINSLKKQLAESQCRENILMSDNSKLKAAVDEKVDLLRNNELTYNKLYAEYTDLESRMKTSEKERDTFKTCEDLYKKKIKENTEDKKRLFEENKCLSLERDQFKKMMENVKGDKRKLEDEIKETKKRLSQVMGTKLSADNPDIADLSDQNRPTKLAEKYSELYDNEWTDAYEAVEELTDDKQAIKTLLVLLQDIQRFCGELANSQTENIRSAVMMTFSQGKSPSEFFNTQIKNFRRATSMDAIGGVIEHYMENLQRDDTSKYDVVNKTKVRPFVHKCLELCWLMAAQSPPVVFAKLTEQETKERFDTNIYKPYTKTGAFVDFVVWPPLYLHNQGSLLAKGVAQGRGVLSLKDANTKKGPQASAFPGTAVPVQNATKNDMARSFNVKSGRRTNMGNLSNTVYGASGYYDNDFSSISPGPEDPPCD